MGLGNRAAGIPSNSEIKRYKLLRLNPKVRKDLDDFHTSNPSVKDDFYEALDVIVTTPKHREDASRDIKHLEGKYGKIRGLYCHYRFRLLEDHRIIYKVDDDELEIDIVYLGPHP